MERFNFPILASERWSGGLLPKEHSSPAPYFGRRRNEIRRRSPRLLKSVGFLQGTTKKAITRFCEWHLLFCSTVAWTVLYSCVADVKPKGADSSAEAT